jgi:hypothetical protein
MLRWDGQFSDRLLEIIDWCLNLNHLYRPQSVFALQRRSSRPLRRRGRKQSELDRSLCRENQKADVMRFTIYQESRQGGRANNEDRTTYCYSRDAC